MVYVAGTARIRHAETGEIYEISSDMLDFDAVAGGERRMGPETEYSAILEHPELGQLVWSIWEYPVGAENYRETDVGKHEVLQNVDFGLQHEPPEPDEEVVDETAQEETRQARIDALVEWFFDQYEDPAHRLPYVSAEGGYQWIYGGPFDAREQLDENFPDESEDIINAAVDEIESDGLTDWAPVATPEDYGQDEEPPDDSNPADIVRELEALIEDLPSPNGEPAFQAGEDGLIHMATPSDAAPPDEDESLLNELRDATGDLLNALAGTNAHTDLQNNAQRYSEAIDREMISVSQVYARGVRLANAGEATRDAIARDDLLPLPQDTDGHLSSVLDLNSAFIMAQAEGRDLAEGAAYQRTSSDHEAMRDAAREFAKAVEAASNIFGEDVQRHVAQAAEDIGLGPQPARSNQTAASVFGNLTRSLLKDFGKAAIIGSVPLVALVSGGTQLVDLVWSFLFTNASMFQAVAGAFGADLSWMTPVSHLLQHLKRRRPAS